MENKIMKFLESEDYEINTDMFVIKDNILRFSNITVQLSNISQIYVGKRRLQIPRVMIGIFFVSLILIFVLPPIGIIGCGLSGWYIFNLYKTFLKSKNYLSFRLNSGNNYIIAFEQTEFLEEVRTVVEASFNKKHSSYTVNIAEQKIIEGDEHILENKGGFVNFGIQEDHSSTVYNQDSFNHHEETIDSSVSFGDITDSTIQSDIIGSSNAVQTEAATIYDWEELTKELQTVISSIKIDTPVKIASQEALAAAQEQDSKKFEGIIKSRKSEFLSELFLNTAGGVLTQVISLILKLT